jgi:hypothetical protein
MDNEIPASLPGNRKRVGAAKGGRKKILESEKHKERIVLRFTEEEFAKLEAQHAQSGRPLAVIVRSLLAAQSQQPQPWTAEQFRVCRQLADLYGELIQLKKQAEREGLTLAEAKFGEAAEQVNKFLDSLSI